MRISDWSSDVCSSDLVPFDPTLVVEELGLQALQVEGPLLELHLGDGELVGGRLGGILASCLTGIALSIRRPRGGCGLSGRTLLTGPTGVAGVGPVLARVLGGLVGALGPLDSPSAPSPRSPPAIPSPHTL